MILTGKIEYKMGWGLNITRVYGLVFLLYFLIFCKILKELSIVISVWYLGFSYCPNAITTLYLSLCLEQLARKQISDIEDFIIHTDTHKQTHKHRDTYAYTGTRTYTDTQ